MNGQLVNFGQGIYLLIGILTVAILAAGLLFLTWTALNILRFRREQLKAAHRYNLEHFDEAGHVRPPRAPGVCDVCGRVQSELSVLAGNRRICDACMSAGEPPRS